MSTLIMKFGGSALGTTAALAQVLSIVLHETQQWDRVLIVASALEGVTDQLLEAAQHAQINHQRGYRRIISTLRTRHIAMAEQLPLGVDEQAVLRADIGNLLFRILEICQSLADSQLDTIQPQYLDEIVAVGEQLAARIIAALLREKQIPSVAIDSTDIIITDENYGNASPIMDLTAQRIQNIIFPMMEQQIIPVITGYIGATQSGEITTLGRGGTDYTASILSTCVQSDEVWIWADVDGIMSADPRIVPNSQLIEELPYRETAELAYFGARILHNRMIPPLQAADTPIRIKNIFKPQQAGTYIYRFEPDRQSRLKAVTTIQGLALTAERSGSLYDITRLVDRTLGKTIGSQAEVMITSQSSNRSFVCFVIPTSANIDAFNSIRAELENKFSDFPNKIPWNIELVSIVTIVGSNINTQPQLSATVFSVLQNIPILGIAQGPSGCSLSVVVPQTHVEKTLREIHREIIKND